MGTTTLDETAAFIGPLFIQGFRAKKKNGDTVCCTRPLEWYFQLQDGDVFNLRLSKSRFPGAVKGNADESVSPTVSDALDDINAYDGQPIWWGVEKIEKKEKVEKEKKEEHLNPSYVARALAAYSFNHAPTQQAEALLEGVASMYRRELRRSHKQGWVYRFTRGDSYAIGRMGDQFLSVYMKIVLEWYAEHR